MRQSMDASYISLLTVTMWSVGGGGGGIIIIIMGGGGDHYYNYGGIRLIHSWFFSFQMMPHLQSLLRIFARELSSASKISKGEAIATFEPKVDYIHTQ